MEHRRRITRAVGATAGALLASAAVPMGLARADDEPFAEFTTAVGNSAATSVASSLDSTLSQADPSLAATIAGYVADPSTIPTGGLTTAPGTDNAFGDLLGSDATAAQITEANELDAILYADLAAAGQTSTIAALDTEASTLVTVVAPANEEPFTDFAAAVGNPDPDAAVLDANLDPDLAATLAGYVQDPSTIPTGIPAAPPAEDAFASLLPADATAAQIAEATELDNALYAAVPNEGAESAFYAPSVTPALDDPFSDFATMVGSTDSASGVASLDAALFDVDPTLGAVLNGYVDGILSVPGGLLTAPAGDDPFTELLPSGASAADIAEAEDLDNALYTGLTNAGDTNLAATLGADAAALTSTTVTSTPPAADPFTELAVSISSILSPPRIAGLDGDFIKADPALAATFAGYVLDPSSIPTTGAAAPAGDQAFADLLPSTATAAQITEATNLDNVLYADDPTVAALLGADASTLIPAVTSPVTPPVTPPLDPITLFEQDLSTTIANATSVFSAGQEAANALLSGDTAAVAGNLETALEAVTLSGAPDVVSSAVANQTLGGVSEATAGGLLNGGLAIPIEGVHEQVYEGLLGQGFGVPGGSEGDLITALDNFAASPLSGVLIGAVGPFVSPEVALLNSVDNVVTDLTAGDPTAALTELEDTPINAVNAFFNGATLNLDSLAPIFESFVNTGDSGGESITGLSLAFGGLFSPGSVVDGVGDVENGVGGSLLNSLGLDLAFMLPDDDAGATVDVPAIAVGPIAALDGLLNTLGEVFNGSLLFP
ncbi:MAG TPA: outer membrane porin GjpA [Mycobacterium sp.]|nr:outer membrane porin GjpA [Mycobacterium sp.]